MHEKFFHPTKGLIFAIDLEETEALLILSTFPGLGNMRIQKLLAHFGSATAALLADLECIQAVIGRRQKSLDRWQSWPQAEDWKQNIALVAKMGISLISFKDKTYPQHLLQLADFPPLLYMQGKAIDQKCIAIVGTRAASIYGMEMASLFARELAQQGYTIVSGLARGIDTAAHMGALDSGKTVAVIGSGLAQIYPKENLALAHKIQQTGALISELPMLAPPDRQNFPQRNRIVAGVVEGILLIEAPLSSGAMITMNLGYANQKKLFALPGRVDMNFSGNHALIKKQKAVLVESAADILKALDNEKTLVPSVVNAKSSILLDKDEQQLLSYLPQHEISIDALAALTKMAIPPLNALLMSLLLKGIIKEFPGRLYKKIG